ncbi:MetQ/NlpA family ABC transporter substrate-binding protein [Bordetella sp. 2513F-2]
MSIKFFKALGVLALGAATLFQPALGADKPFKVGVTAGPHAQVMEAVKQEAARHGLDIEIVEFSDYIQPNAALAAGDLDANSYQHKPFLDSANADRGYKLVAVAKTVMFPMGIFSKTLKSLDALPEGGRISLPNDPSNEGRALILLEQQGIIKLDPKAGLRATPLDVVENPRKLRFVELEAAQLPRSLDDVDASVVPTNYALPAGLNPTTDAIARESADSPYAGILAVREADKDSPRVRQLIEAFHSQPVKDYIDREFKGALTAAW